MDSVITNFEIWPSNSQLLYPVVMAMGAILLAVISSYATYRFTRNMQLEAEWRKDKLKYYDQLLNSITETMSMPENFNEVYKNFALASNAVSLIASQEVTNILFEFYYADQVSFDDEESDNPSKQIELLQKLLLAMRKDLRIKPSDNPSTFKYKLRSPLYSED